MNKEKKSNLALHAFVDGELDGPESQRMQSAIDADPELAREYRAIVSLKRQLKSEFTDIQSSEPPLSMIDSVRNYQPAGGKSVPQSLSWVAAACLIAGVMGGYLWGSQPQDSASYPLVETNWIEQVVSYHDMYTLATLEHVKSSEHERRAMLDRLSKSMNRTLLIPEFSGSSLEFKRGQILRSNDQPVVQLAYLDLATGSPVAVCITPDNQAKSSGNGDRFIRGSAFELNYVNWQNNGLDFLVVGSFDAEEISRLALQVQNQFTEV